MIYCSATLEHFLDYQEKARIILKHCKVLYVLVPYAEQRFGRDLVFTKEGDHVATFREGSFNYLHEEGLAASIPVASILNVPGAWSWTVKDYLIQPIKNILRLLIGRPLVWNRKMILFEIVSTCQQ